MHQRLMALTKKITGAVAAIALLIMVAVVTFAFKAPIQQKRVDVQYQYVSNSDDTIEIKDVANWEEVDVSSPSCGTAGSLVCRYTFDGDIAAFEIFLEDPDTTPAFLAENADATKN